MDCEESFQKLSVYWARVCEAEKLPRFKGQRTPALHALNQQLPEINRILRELAPDLPAIHAEWINQHVAAWPTVSRALDIITAWRAMTVNWIGEAPALPLRLLDPAISGPSLPLWQAGKYRQAVSEAATSLDRFAQERLGRHDVYGTPLMNEAFSDDPPKRGRPRLRCPGDHRLKTVRSQQEGARLLAAGAFKAIRNPASHETGDWNPIDAFHYLTVLSQIAHWFRYWDVKVYTPPTPDFSKALAELQKARAAEQLDSATAVPPPGSAQLPGPKLGQLAGPEDTGEL